MAGPVRVRGVQETLRDLRTLEPTLYKATMRTIKRAAKPLQSAAQGALPASAPLSGFAHGGRTGWSRSAARVSVNTGGRKSGGTWTLVKVRLNGAAGSLFDMAGRGSSGDTPQGAALVENLTSRYGAASRAMWPAAEHQLPTVQRQVVAAIDDATSAMNVKLKTDWVV